jgi:hypothetical protein
MSKSLRNSFDNDWISRKKVRTILEASGWKKNKTNNLWHKKTRNTPPEPTFYTLRQAWDLHNEMIKGEAA